MILFGDRYVSFIEQQITLQREDFQARLADKDAEIRRLRGELAGARMVVPAVGKRLAPIPMVELPQGPLDWAGELNQMLKEEEEKSDGVPSE